MKSRKANTPVWLIVALALVLALVLGPGLGEALGNEPGQEWVSTPDAQIRTADGDCGEGMICKELCYFGLPQGEFFCFSY